MQKEPGRLWHYNNGISAVCKRFEHDEKTGTVRIDNLKIVNGCQTISTITKPSSPNSDASVVFRLSEINDDEFRENVSKYTNRQNRTVQPDLASDHQYLLNLEKGFAEYKPFFWERKRGSASCLDDEAKRRIKGKQGLYIIKNPDAARLKMAYVGKPHLAIQLSQEKLFRVESSYFQELYKDADPRDFIVPHVLHYWLNAIEKRLDDPGSDSGNDTDKNIKFLLKYRIGRQYVIAIIAKILSSVDDEDAKSRIADGIVSIASDYDSVAAGKVMDELERLAGWVARVTPKILDKPASNDNIDEKAPVLLYKRDMYYLRDRLREANRLGSFCAERESLCELFEGQKDPFLTKLRDILKV